MREFVIDNDLRIITPPEGVPILGVEHDANVHRLQFSMPRMYGDVDLSTFELRVNYRNANRETDMYVVTDAEVIDDRISFSWLVGRHALQYKGRVQFIVCLRRMTVDGDIEQELNSTLAELPVLEGLEADLTYYEEENARDVVQQLLGMIDARGAEVLADISDRAPAIIRTASGPIVSISDGATAPAVQLISHIEPVQAGSGDPSPDNVRAISGWNELNVLTANKNILTQKNIKALPYTHNGITFDDGGEGKITLSGTATAVAQLTLVNRGVGGKQFIKAGTYTLSGTTGASKATLYIQFYDSNDSAIGNSFLTVQVSSGSPTKTFVLEKDCYYGGYISVGSGNTPTGVIAPQIEVGAMATEYEKHQEKTLTAELPETVYSGTLDWVTGVLTITHGYMVFDGSKIDKYQVSSAGMPNVVTKKEYDTPAAVTTGIYSSHYSIFSSAGHDKSIRTLAKAIHIYDARFTSQEVAAEILDANPVQIVYPLTNPYTIQLTPQQLEMMKGGNYVWSNCGDTELTYIADTKSYIDGKFAELQNAILAQGANI